MKVLKGFDWFNKSFKQKRTGYQKTSSEIESILGLIFSRLALSIISASTKAEVGLQDLEICGLAG